MLKQKLAKASFGSAKLCRSFHTSMKRFDKPTSSEGTENQVAVEEHHQSCKFESRVFLEHVESE